MIATCRAAQTILIASLALVAIPGAQAQSADIYRATLAEANQKTAEVSTEEVRRILRDHSALILDSRPPAEFAAGHIPDAQTIGDASKEPVAMVEALTHGDKAKALVLYCNGPFCQASRRLADKLVSAGFTNVRRYQLGMPIWRALGGPTAITLEGVLRIYGRDQTAVFFDARSAGEFARLSLPHTHNLPADDLANGALKKAPLPLDDFNTRIVLIGKDATQARTLADALSKRPWHNVVYFAGSFEELRAAMK